MTEEEESRFAGQRGSCWHVRCCTVLDMAHVLRYAGIALAVLVFAIVLLMCGEGACGACLDACCSRLDPGRRGSVAVDRVLTALKSFGSPIMFTGRLASGACPAPVTRIPHLTLEVSTLRI